MSIAIKDQVEFIVASLADWGTTNLKAKAQAVPHLQAAWAIVSQREGAAKLLVTCDGEDPRVNFAGGEATGMQDRAFSVVVSRGRGLKADRGDSLTEGAGGGRPFYDLLDELINLIRSMQLGDENTLYYRGFNIFGTEFGMLSDAYRIRFAAGTLRQIY